MNTLIKIAIIAMLFGCKKKELNVCYLVQTETTTIYKEASPNFYRYGSDRQDYKQGSLMLCNLKKKQVDSLLALPQIGNFADSLQCTVIHIVVTKIIRDK
jgi:hypothetical protein